MTTAYRRHTRASTPAQPGEELEQLRREIGRMAREEAAQWEYSDELDPDWPPSAKVYKQRRKEPALWDASTLQEGKENIS